MNSPSVKFERLLEHVIQEHAARAEIDAVAGPMNDGSCNVNCYEMYAARQKRDNANVTRRARNFTRCARYVIDVKSRTKEIGARSVLISRCSSCRLVKNAQHLPQWPVKHPKIMKNSRGTKKQNNVDA